MAVKFFVGSLAYSVTDDELRAVFADLGTVESAKVVLDRETQKSRGFGFVEMAIEEDQAAEVIKQTNGKEIGGRGITVDVARPMTDRGPRPQFNGGGDRGGFRN